MSSFLKINGYKTFIGADSECTDLPLKMHRWMKWGFGEEAQMEKSFHFDLSLSRDLELLRVSRLTDANTGRKSDADMWQAQLAGNVFL